MLISVSNRQNHPRRNAAVRLPYLLLFAAQAFSQTTPAVQPNFEAQILPIFRTACAGCHGLNRQEAGLRLDSLQAVLKGAVSGPVVARADSRNSILYRRVAAADHNLRMPPIGTGLNAQQLDLIARWIDAGTEIPAAHAKVDFASDVQPILRASCLGCHSGPDAKSELKLDVKSSVLQSRPKGQVVVPGAAEKSRMLQRIEGRGGEPQMPFNGKPLAAEQIATLRRWINQGAVWPEQGESKNGNSSRHWAYIKPVKAVPPTIAHAAQVRNPIDQFLLARLEKEGLTYSAPATKEQLARRLYLDLTGLPPSPSELDAFLADAAPDAYEKLVDKLLVSPHFGERWARPWLDLARYADSNGYEADAARKIWMFRDWVIDAFNKDLPFDQFTIDQIAGDMLPNATVEQRIATGFHRNTQLNLEGGVDKDESHFEVLVDRVATTGTVWLGSTLGCAQCHNHKFDPFKQKDFYAMMAFFSNTEKKPAENGGADKIYQEPVLEAATPAQQLTRDAMDAHIRELVKQTETSTPELKAAQTSWEIATLQAERTWKVLQPAKVSARSGTVLTADGEGRILATGEKPRNEVYVIEADLPVPVATAIRVQALPYAALPRGGPGRDPYGNFTLTRVQVETLEGTTWTPVPIKNVAADTGKPSLDRKRGQLWTNDASREDERLARQLVIVLREPLNAQRIRVQIVQESEFGCQSIGYFQLSATGASDPAAVVNSKHSLRAALGKPDRSPEVDKKLSEYYLSISPALQPVRDELKLAREEVDKLDLPSTMVMRQPASFERASDFIRIRGAFGSRAEKVYANVPEFLPPLPESELPNRLGLARWLVSKDNPLTARVAVNRIWEQYFGRGLVETSEDFGTQGQKPSHPELLDWLAVEFMDRGWSMKAIHRVIVTSNAYRQSSAVTPQLYAKDPYNRLLARGPRFRMDAEMIRDSSLTASGLLSAKIGGPSVYPPQPPGIWDMPYNDEKYVESKGEDRYRRGVYTFIRRSAPYPALVNFDATSREQCTVRRTRTNTPLQALTLLNDEAFFEAASALAKRMAAEGGAAARTRIDYGFRLCTGRHATPGELDYLTNWEAAQARQFAANREQAKKLGGDPDAAAWTMVANVLLNTDEAITKE
jgi:mono/diheme cytochrome c family protein